MTEEQSPKRQRQQAQPQPKQTTKKHHSNDRFLSTMTFANMDFCDCDECDVPRSSSDNPNVPSDIADAIKRHKKQTMLQQNYVPSLISQERVLLSRYDGVSLWKWNLPPGASPKVEYGNSHRFILVDRIPSVTGEKDSNSKQKRIVKSLGKGIIGSSSEVDTRRIEPWVEKCGYVCRSNGGKAVGFVNDLLEADKDLNVSDTSNDVVLIIVKVTHKMLETFRKDSMEEDLTFGMPSWVPKILMILDKYLDGDGDGDGDGDDGANANANGNSNASTYKGKRVVVDALQPQKTSSSSTTESITRHNGMEMTSKDVNSIREIIDPFLQDR